jgi:hypothetical protein
MFIIRNVKRRVIQNWFSIKSKMHNRILKSESEIEGWSCLLYDETY